MATNWLAIELAKGADEGIAKLLGNEQAAQAHIAERINGGVAPERLQLFSAVATPFGVAYQPIITIGEASASGAPAAAAPDAGATGQKPANGKDGQARDNEPVAAVASEAQGTQDGVRLSSMFKTD
jgi:hypothetical protein